MAIYQKTSDKLHYVTYLKYIKKHIYANHNGIMLTSYAGKYRVRVNVRKVIGFTVLAVGKAG